MDNRIKEHVENTVLGTSPGSKESVEAIKAYNEFMNNENERMRNELDLKLKQDIHEDDLRKARDEAMIEDDKFKHQRVMDWIDRGLKIAGLITTTVLTCIAIRDDKDGKPWFGPAKDFFSNMIRRGN